jgi:hypothetical protein
MTVGTATGDASMVHRRATFERSGVLMTSFTRRCGGEVGCWFGFHSSEVTAVAGRTTSSDTSVIHDRTFKAGGRCMTSFTRLSSWNVC